MEGMMDLNAFEIDDDLMEIAVLIMERAVEITKSKQFIDAMRISEGSAKLKIGRMINDDKIIEFYGVDKGNNDINGAYFSNCVVSPFIYRNVAFMSSEHWFQIMKFLNVPLNDNNLIKFSAIKGISKKETQEKCNAVANKMLGFTPVYVAQFGRRCREVPIRDFWESSRTYYMACALYLKFTTSNDLFRQKLLSTGDAVLIERAPNDNYWAISTKTSKGQNMLGALLMATREFIRSK